MCRLVRRKKKLNSENENLFIYDENEVAKIGPLPYDSMYDVSKNGITHIIDTLYFSDNNWFSNNSYESHDFKNLYKI